MLTKNDWQPHGHAPGEPRTIEKLLELLAEHKSQGPKRKGAKTEPFWKFIPILNYAICLLHILIGVFNDINQHVLAHIDADFVPITPDEQKLRDEIKTLEPLYEARDEARKQWAQTDKGKQRAKLVKRKKDQDKKIKQGKLMKVLLTADEVNTLLELEAKHNVYF